jgi:hypothetical protein
VGVVIAVPLRGAKGRLLPRSIPFRYFGAAAVYHVLAWIALFADAQGFPGFAGGLGWPLASLHLLTLGVLAMAAIGASLQLLPVATRQPIHWRRGPALVWWLFTPGVALVAIGMGCAKPLPLAAGAILVALALILYAALLARNLAGARGMPVIVAHCWVAWMSLVVVVVTALSLALAYAGVPGMPRGAALSLHVAFAAYGFMGMLVLGLSYIVVPMFALSKAPDERSALASCLLAVLALAFAAAAAFAASAHALRLGAAIAGALAVALHLHLMLTALRSGMRRDSGRTFLLVRGAWVMLAASLATAAALAVDADVPGLQVLFGVLLVPGWLLTFLLGVLQRIVPFLGAMHAAGHAARAPLPSALTAERPLDVHCACHFVALALLALAAMFASARLAEIAAAIGAVGAIAFAVFFTLAQWRLARTAATPPVPTT